MRIVLHSSCVAHYRSTRARAFSLPEMMLAAAILVVLMGGILTSHLFGIRMFEITKAKLSASDEARHAVSLLTDEIRTAKIVRIGSGGLSSFTEVAPNSLQQGSAIQIHGSTNTSTFVRYFWDSTDKKLKRTTNGSIASLVVANSITNALIFTSENYKGVTLTNNENNRVIGLLLQFYQIQYPIIKIGPGEYFDYYQLRTRITRRALE